VKHHHYGDLRIELPPDMAADYVLAMIESFATHPMKSAAGFRNAVLETCAFTVNPMLNYGDKAQTIKLSQVVMDRVYWAVSSGRMIDFGFIPNEVMKAESLRSRNAFEAGELVHPYEEGWLGVSRWEGGFNAYYVEPHPTHPGEINVIEMYATSMPGDDAIMLYDSLKVQVRGIDDTVVTPAPMRETGQTMTMSEEAFNHFQASRGANSLDPLVTMLRLLADASVPIDHFIPPPALNRAREKSGKPHIPSHTVVHSKDYVTNFHSSGKRGESRGGHHASPVAHWRRSHPRHLASGRVVQVKSSKVNWRDGEELHRLFYKV
jgi:hypothetical protein